MQQFLTGSLMLAVLFLLACKEQPQLPDLFVPLEDQSLATAVSEPGLVRSRLVQLDAELLGRLSGKDDVGDRPVTVQLGLFPDLSVPVEFQVSPESDGEFRTLTGRVIGEATSLVTLVLHKGKLQANIRFAGRLFHIRPAGEKMYRIKEITPVALPAHGPVGSKNRNEGKN